MSSIPNAKMKHAHVPDEQPAPAAKSKKAKTGPTLTERAQDLAEDAVDAVKARPKTAAAIGAGLVAGAAALVGAATGAFRGDDKKPAAKKTATPKKATPKKKG